MKTTTEMQLVNVDKLIPYVNNARTHSTEQINKLRSSLREFGFINPVIVDRDYNIVAGHGRVTAAKAEGIKEVPCVFADFLTEAQKKAYILADNRMALDAGWDEELLKIEIESLKAEDFDIEFTGFSEDELVNYFKSDEADSGEEDNFDVDKAIEEETDIERGQIFKLGDHYLMCGDSTSKNDVECLMSAGGGYEKADMVFTDPPYNTGMKAKNNRSAWLSGFFDDSFSDSEWETFMSSFCKKYFDSLKEDSVAYICLDWRRSYQLIPHIKDNFELSNIIVWDKMVHGLGSDYKYTYELIHVCKKGKPTISNKDGDREYQDVWHIQRKIGRDEEHATKKPIELCSRCIRHGSTTDDIVLDLFGGSGSTLIACEQLNRKCRMMEIEPHYCAVIIKRWETLTGKKAELLVG